MVTTYHDKLLGRKTIIIASWLVLFRLPIINKRKKNFFFRAKEKTKKKKKEKKKLFANSIERKNTIT